MKNILITGSNCGLDLGFVKYYFNSVHRVWTSCSNEAGSLEQLKSSILALLKWDVTEPLTKLEQTKLLD